MLNDLPDAHPELFHKDASVIRAPDWRRINMRLDAEIRRVGLTVEDVSLGVGSTFHLMAWNGEKPLSVQVLRWFARAGVDVNFVLTGCTAPKRADAVGG